MRYNIFIYNDLLSVISEFLSFDDLSNLSMVVKSLNDKRNSHIWLRACIRDNLTNYDKNVLFLGSCIRENTGTDLYKSQLKYYDDKKIQWLGDILVMNNNFYNHDSIISLVLGKHRSYPYHAKDNDVLKMIKFLLRVIFKDREDTEYHYILNFAFLLDSLKDENKNIYDIMAKAFFTELKDIPKFDKIMSDVVSFLKRGNGNRELSESIRR